MKEKHIGLILQKIYDSEIHLRIGWLWDGGLEYSIGTSGFDVWEENKNPIEHTGEDSLLEGFQIMFSDICKRYPKSEFTKWYRIRFKY